MASIQKEKNVTLSNGKKVSVHAEIYNSVRCLEEDCNTRSVHIDDYRLNNSDIHKDWHGVDSYEEAVQYLRDGYSPVVESLKTTLKRSDNQEKTYRSFNNICGYVPVVPLALKNIPTNMVDMDRNVPKDKVIDIYYDITANCDKEVEQFLKAGEALLSVLIGLEQSGYRFNLYAVQSYNNDTKTDLLCVKVKSSDRPLDIKRMSFALIHPSFFRVIGFTWESQSPVTRYVGFGRGTALRHAHSKESISKIIQSTFGDNAHYISGALLIENGYDKEYIKEEICRVQLKEKRRVG